MCDTCASPHEAGGLPRRFGLLPIAIILLLGPLLLLKPLGVVGNEKTSKRDNLADRVFVRDLADQSARGIELGEALVSRASHPRARARAERFLAQERLERRAALAVGGDAAAGAARSSPPAGGASLLRAAARHAREDVLLAGIELRSGRSRQLRQLARRIVDRAPTDLKLRGASDPR